MLDSYFLFIYFWGYAEGALCSQPVLRSSLSNCGHFDARVVAVWFGAACRISVAIFDLQMNRVCWHKCVCLSAVLLSLSQFPSGDTLTALDFFDFFDFFFLSSSSLKPVLRTEFVNSRHLSKERKREKIQKISGQ